jgi:hypothetical protein
MEPDWDEYIRENIRYDPETGLLWWKYQNCGRGKLRDLKKPLGVLGNDGHTKVGLCLQGSKRAFQATHIAWFIHYGVWPKQKVFHRDGDKSNIKVSNLSYEDLQKTLHHRLGYKNIYFYKNERKWCAYLKDLYNKHVNVGCYDTPEEAARAYDKAAKEIFGEYANLNFPESEHNAS